MIEVFHLLHGRTNHRTFSALGDLYHWALAADTIRPTVDCAGLAFCGGNLASALAVLQTRLSLQGKTLQYVNVRQPVRSLLADVGLFGPSQQRQRSTVAPLTNFQSGESSRFATYTQRNLTNKGLPLMTPRLQARVFEGIDELFTNFEIHSRSRPGAWACGQLFPGKGSLEFTIADHGEGIPRIVNAAGHLLSPARAIDWAMTGNNTTRSGDVPGGLGLKVLREFIALNAGALTIASHGGFWSETAGKRVMSSIPNPFPGTAITIMVNTKDKQSYRLADEIKPGDVF